MTVVDAAGAACSHASMIGSHAYPREKRPGVIVLVDEDAVWRELLRPVGAGPLPGSER